MIAGGSHRVTGGDRIVVECDTFNCPNSMYLPPNTSLSLYGAREAMQTLGWTVSAYAEGKPMHATCPTHGATP